MKLRTTFWLGAGVIALLTGNAHAQASTDAPPGSGTGIEEGNDLIITAQRREQRLQDVPIPVTAFSAEAADRLQLEDAFDVAKYVPATHVTQSAFKGTATFFIRAVGSLDITSTVDPPVTFYENDLIIARPNANNIGLFDVERIEVLRGPQGTLFGRNTSGGAVNIILKKPGEEAGGHFEGSLGSYSKTQIRGSVDAPISDTVLTKTSGFFLRDPGFIHNITTGERVGGERNWGLREDVRILPGGDLTWDLSAEYTQNEGLGFSLRQAGTPAPRPTAPPQPVYYENNSGIRVSEGCDDPLATWSKGGGGNCSLTQSLALGSDLKWDTGAGSLQLLYGFRQYWARYQFDSTNNTTPVYGGGGLFSDGYGFSHSGELKWSSDLWDDRISYVAGLYYINIVDSNRLSSAGYNAATSVRSYTQDIRIRTDTNSYAAYLQGDIKLADPLVLTLGGRFTHDVKKLAYIPQTQYGAPTISTDQVIAQGQPIRLEENRFTPRIALQYKILPDVSVFASATNGFKAGGWNGRVNNPALVVAVEPERVWAYELGLRSQFLDRKVTLNLTAFHQDVQGYQNTVQVLLPRQTQITTLLQNIADFRVRGLEFEAAYTPTERLSLTTSGSWLDAAYTRAYPFVGVPASSQLSVDEPVTQAPKFQITAGPSYRLPLGGDAAATFSGTYRHMSPYQISILNPVKTPTDDFLDLNLQLDSGKNWYGSIACTNCLDRKSYMLILRNFVYPADPLRITGTIGFRF